MKKAVFITDLELKEVMSFLDRLAGVYLILGFQEDFRSIKVFIEVLMRRQEARK